MPSIITLATKAMQELIKSGIDTLTNRLTETRASNLDKLDAPISSMSTLTAQEVWSAPSRTLTQSISAVKSIQTGFIKAAKLEGSGEDVNFRDITVSSVDTSKTIVFIQPHTREGKMYSGRMVDSKTLRVAMCMSITAIRCRWYIVEFN